MLAAGVATTVATLGLLAALALGHATYVAEAEIRISPSSPSQLASGGYHFNSTQDYRDYVQQQVFEIDSYATATAGLERLGSKRWLWQKRGESDRRAAERLMGSLKINPVRDSYFVTVSLEGESPQGLADIVNAVVNAYLAREADQEVNAADMGVQLLSDRKSDLEQRKAGDEQQLSKLAQALGIGSIAGEIANPYDKLLSDENTAAMRAHRDVTVAEARLDTIKAHRDRIQQLEIDSKVQEMAASSPETTPVKQQLLQEREAALLELSGLGPKHPARAGLEQKIAEINAELKNVDNASLDEVRASLNKSESANSHVSISQAEVNLDQAQRTEQGILRDLDALRGEATSFGTRYSQGIALHDRIERESKELQDVDDQISALRLERQAPGFVSLDSAALMPDLPQNGRRRVIFLLSLLGATGLGVAVPMALDLIDPRIRTVAELEGVLGFPPLGATLLGNDRSDREGLRRIALAVLRERRTSGVRAFALTSVREGAGTTTLTLALARELSALGAPTAAIEANMVSPDKRYVENGKDKPPRRDRPEAISVGATRGLTRQLAMTGPLEARSHALVRTGDAEPELFSICRHDGSSGLTMECVLDTVKRALETHDMVLLDGPSLLASADPVLLLQIPAGALLVVRAERDEIREIKAAGRELERISPPVVGTILNSGLPTVEGKNLVWLTPPSAPRTKLG